MQIKVHLVWQTFSSARLALLQLNLSKKPEARWENCIQSLAGWQMPSFSQHWVGEWGSLIPRCCLSRAGLSLLCAAPEHGAHGQGLMLCSEVCQHPRQTLQLWHVAQDSFFPHLVGWGTQGLKYLQGCTQWVLSMGYVHKVFKPVLEASQWHSCLSHWRGGVSWICCRGKKSTYLF